MDFLKFLMICYFVDHMTISSVTVCCSFFVQSLVQVFVGLLLQPPIASDSNQQAPARLLIHLMSQAPARFLIHLMSQPPTRLLILLMSQPPTRLLIHLMSQDPAHLLIHLMSWEPARHVIHLMTQAPACLLI